MSGDLAHDASNLLPTDLRAELRIAGIRQVADQLRFRLDPGRAFELLGWVFRWEDGKYWAGTGQRYQPNLPMIPVAAGTGLTADRFPEWLRSAVRHASVLAADEPAWQRARQPVPAWQVSWSARQDAAAVAVRMAAKRARATQRTHFVYRDQHLIICSVKPPGHGRFFSVSRGHWSAHQGLDTIPLERSPLARELTNPVGLAATDRPRVFAASTVPYATPSRLPASGAAPRAARGR